MPLVGVPTLRNLCVSLLIEFRDCIEDIGDTPLELVQPVLLQCNAEQLASVEDGTREGGRDLQDALQLHWQRNFLGTFGWHNTTVGSTSQSSGMKLASRDWRQLYESAEEAHHKKAAGLRERLRAMTQAEQKSRQTRHVEVIAPTRAFAKQKASRQSANSKSPRQVIPARQRVLSKLGLLHNKSLKHLVRIRPARAVQPSPPRHAYSSKQLPAKQMPRMPRAAAQLAQPKPALPGSGSAPLGTQTHSQSQQQRSILQVANHDKARHDAASGHAMNSTKWTVASAVHSQPLGLVEADIDWLPSAASTQTVGELAAQPAAEQAWTVQFLEQGMQHTSDDVHQHELTVRTASTISDHCDVDLDQQAPKRGSFAWVEDAIPWD